MPHAVSVGCQTLPTHFHMQEREKMIAKNVPIILYLRLANHCRGAMLPCYGILPMEIERPQHCEASQY